MLDKHGNRIVEVGHGFIDGEDSYCLDAVRKARKEYQCEGVIRAVRWSDNPSPGTGASILEMQSGGCTWKIRKGDLHAVLILNDVELYGTYWRTWRMCIPCAVSGRIVKKRRGTATKSGK
jgi:hypothetical protein